MGDRDEIGRRREDTFREGVRLGTANVVAPHGRVHSAAVVARDPEPARPGPAIESQGGDGSRERSILTVAELLDGLRKSGRIGYAEFGKLRYAANKYGEALGHTNVSEILIESLTVTRAERAEVVDSRLGHLTPDSRKSIKGRLSRLIGEGVASGLLPPQSGAVSRSRPDAPWRRACVDWHGPSVDSVQLPFLGTDGRLVGVNILQAEKLFGLEVTRLALRRHNGNLTRAARDLGVNVQTLSNRMARYRETGLLPDE